MHSNTVEEEVGYNEAAAKLWSVAVWINVEHVYASSARRQLPLPRIRQLSGTT